MEKEPKRPGRTPKSKQTGAAFDSEAALIAYMKEVANRKKISPTQLANMTGLERRQVGRILEQEISPSVSSLFKIANALGIRFRLDTQNIELFEFVFVPNGWVDETEWKEIE